jgi:hypothetical protein
MAKPPPKAISSVRRLVRSAYSQRHSNLPAGVFHHTPTEAPGGRGIAATGRWPSRVAADHARPARPASTTRPPCLRVIRPTNYVRASDQMGSGCSYRAGLQGQRWHTAQKVAVSGIGPTTRCHPAEINECHAIVRVQAVDVQIHETCSEVPCASQPAHRRIGGPGRSAACNR